MDITGLVAAGSPDLRVPERPTRQRLQSIDSSGVVRIGAIENNGTHTVRFIVDPDGRYLTITITGDKEKIELTLAGTITLQADGVPRPYNSTGATALLVRGGQQGIAIVASPPPTGMLLKRDLEVTQPSWLAELSTGLSPDAAHRVSSSGIRSGTLTFEEFENRTRTLRPGERLRLGGFKGHIDALHLDKEGLSGVLYGSVTEITTGLDEHPTALMPSRLEWLMQRHDLALLWGAAIYVFGILLMVVRWIGNPFTGRTG